MATDVRECECVAGSEQGHDDPWQRLIEALQREHRFFSWATGMSAYVGVTEDGVFFGGANIEGENFDEAHVEDETAQTAASVIDRVIEQMAAYRTERERERDAESQP